MAFTAWVVEWVTRSMRSAPTLRATSATVVMTPAATPRASVCVVGTTERATIVPVPRSTATAFVNVPPTSTPTLTPETATAGTSDQAAVTTDGGASSVWRR